MATAPHRSVASAILGSLILAVGCGEDSPTASYVDVAISDASPDAGDLGDVHDGSSEELPRIDGLGEVADLPPQDDADTSAVEQEVMDTGSWDASVDAIAQVDAEPPLPSYPLDDTLRLNHVQALGTHNSYHQQPQAPLHPSHKYTMPTLTDQLEIHGVRQFEWDLHLHVDGHLEVFHIPLIDQVSSCTLFSDCLEETRAWSDANPTHAPLVIWMELKDDVDTGVLGDYVPLTDHYDEVEAAILDVLEPSSILTPDEVRGEHPTLPAALAESGWPTLGSLRGRLVFVFLEDGAHRDAYLEGSPSLEGKLLFVDSDDPSQPFAGFFKINNAQGDFDLVQERVNAGFIVTSNVDDVDGTEENNAAKLAASLESGTHFLSTNYPAVATDGSYFGEIPGGAPVRCNPLVAPDACTSKAIENLSGSEL